MFPPIFITRKTLFLWTWTALHLVVSCMDNSSQCSRGTLVTNRRLSFHPRLSFLQSTDEITRDAAVKRRLISLLQNHLERELEQSESEEKRTTVADDNNKSEIPNEPSETSRATQMPSEEGSSNVENSDDTMLDEVEVYAGVPLPRIILQVLDQNQNLDLSSRSIQITATVLGESNSRSGRIFTSKVIGGEAHFLDLILPLQGRWIIEFRLAENPAEQNSQDAEVSLRSPPLRALSDRKAIHHVRFSPTHSFISDHRTPVMLPVGHVVPIIRLQLLDTTYQVQSEADDCTCSFFLLSEPSTDAQNAQRSLPGSSPIITLLTVAEVFNGSATVRNLLYQPESSAVLAAAQHNPLRIVVRCQVLYALESNPVYTYSGPVQLVTKLEANAHVRFASPQLSFITSENTEHTAVVGIPLPPIAIQLVDSFYQVDNTHTGLLIVASIEGNRLGLSGAYAGVIRGVATFSELKVDPIGYFDDPSVSSVHCVLQFTAGTQGSLPVAGSTLMTAIVTLMRASIQSYRVEFDPHQSVIIEETQEFDWVLHAPLPPIRLRLLSSGNTLDIYQRSISIRLDVVTQGGRFSASFYDGTTLQLPFVNGIVTFDAIRFFSVGPDSIPRLTFTVVGDRLWRATGQILRTGVLRLTRNVVPNFTLRFQEYGSSHFSREGEASFATAGVPLPPILVELLNNANVVDRSSSDLTITVTSDSIALANNVLYVYQGTAMFTELTFTEKLDRSHVFLTFTAGRQGQRAVAGKTLRTGPLTITARKEIAYAVKFCKGESYIEVAGQVRSIVNKVPIPPIRLCVIDSDHSPTSPASIRVPLVITVTLTQLSSNAQLTGTLTVPIQDARAVFEQLIFEANSTHAQSPVLRFCAKLANVEHESPHHVVGMCVQTGSLVVDPFPIAGRNLAFVSGTSIAKEHQSFRVPPDGSGVDFSLQMVDSLYQGGQQAKEDQKEEGATTSQEIDALDPSLRVEVTSNISLLNAQPQHFQKGGMVKFQGLILHDLPKGLNPVLTFSVKGAKGMVGTAVVTGYAEVKYRGPADGEMGLRTVVAEINEPFERFSVSIWQASLLRKLNIDSSRLLLSGVRRSQHVTIEPPDPKTPFAPPRRVEWLGTRVHFKISEPSVRDRNKQKSKDITDTIVSFVRSHRGVEDLQLANVYYETDQQVCDTYYFRNQLEGAELCIRGGIAGCYAPAHPTRGSMPNVRLEEFQPCRQKLMCECYEPALEKVGNICQEEPTLTALCQGTTEDFGKFLLYTLDQCPEDAFPISYRTCLALRPEEIPLTKSYVGVVLGSLFTLVYGIAWKWKLQEKYTTLGEERAILARLTAVSLDTI